MKTNRKCFVTESLAKNITTVATSFIDVQL